MLFRHSSPAICLVKDFAICGFNLHPPLLLIVKSPGEKVWASANSNTFLSTTGRNAGIWVQVFETLATKSPHSMAFIDSSIIRAHQHAAGGKKGAKITPSAVLVED